ncbi:hypothetical protein DFH06DRAFT_1137083 [Mycena polygramma]|nr:hypothetical protein DFH06DRAFT_1137083 [Mycena polygramma]
MGPGFSRTDSFFTAYFSNAFHRSLGHVVDGGETGVAEAETGEKRERKGVERVRDFMPGRDGGSSDQRGTNLALASDILFVGEDQGWRCSENAPDMDCKPRFSVLASGVFRTGTLTAQPRCHIFNSPSLDFIALSGCANNSLDRPTTHALVSELGSNGVPEFGSNGAAPVRRPQQIEDDLADLYLGVPVAMKEVTPHLPRIQDVLLERQVKKDAGTKRAFSAQPNVGEGG